MRNFLKSPDSKLILLLIAILIPINLFLFSKRGEGAEFYGATQYIQFVTQDPQSLGDVRLEPLYIVASYLVWKITNLPLPTIFAASRYLIWAGEIALVYLIFKQITKSIPLSILGTLIFNFSFTQFAMANNLFRNHLGNLLVFGLIFLILKFLKNQNLNFKKYLLAAGVLLGLTTYTHIFTAFVIFATVFLFLLISLFLKIAQKNFYLATFPKNFIKFLTGISLIGLIISLPYIFRTIPFYWVLANSFLTGRGPWEIRQPTPGFSLDTIAASVNNFFGQNIGLTLFRLFFEFKQISLPLLFLGLVFVAVIFVVTKILTPSSLLILSFWLVTYLGSKLELFGVSIVTTRFISVVFYPSILILGFLGKFAFEKLKNNTAKIGLATIIFTVFFAHNLPNILEETVLVNTSQIKKRDELTAQIIKKANVTFVPGTAVFSLNSGLSNLRQDLLLGYPVEFFSTKNVETALELAEPYNLEYFLFDSNIKAVRSSATSGEWIYLDYEKFKDQKYFEKLAESGNSFAAISLYKIKKPGTPAITWKSEVNEFHFRNSQELKGIDKILASREIHQWSILVNLSEGAKTVTEKIETKGGRFAITYPATNFYQIESSKIKNQLTVKLPEIEARKKFDKEINLGIFIPGTVTHLPDAKDKANFSYKAEFAYDHYFLETKLTSAKLSDFAIDFLARDQFRLITRAATTLFGSLVFVGISLFQIISVKKLTFWGFSKKEKLQRLVFSVFIILAILDSAFLSTLLIEFYKNLIS